MADGNNARVVYSTATGRMCGHCGQPSAACTCSAPAAGAVPARVVAKLRVEKKGRGGKTVTVVDNLPRNDAFLEDLCRALKRTCATGGTVLDASVELQGDVRERVRTCLAARGFVVKG